MAIRETAQQFTLRATGAVARRQAISRGSYWVLLGATLLGLFVLAVLIYDVMSDGLTHISRDFFTSYAAPRVEQAGIRAALFGWGWIMAVTIAMAIPVGIGAAIWLEEFAPKNRLTSLIQLNIANLAGVPSIIYGILGLAVFVRLADFGSTILAGGLTLALMILPMTIIASQEAIRQVPDSLRRGSLALGATKWQTVWHHVLPQAVPGIMTGAILAISRAAGETAALIMLGAAGFIAADNNSFLEFLRGETGNPLASLGEGFTSLPIQIYNWTVRPTNQGFGELAAAAIIVLLVFVLTLNLIAAVVRERFRNS